MTGPRRSETPRVLYVAAGGGGDPIACAMIARHFDPDIERPLIASMSWDRLILDPVPGPRAPADFIGLEPIGRLNYRVTGATTLRPPAASSLPRLSRELPADVYLLDPHRGAPGMAAQLAELADLLALDAIRLVDVGGDVVARGDEPELRSPLADALSLAAVAQVALENEVLVAGPGIDGELSAAYVAQRCQLLGGRGTGALSQQAGARLQSVFAWHPSEASGLLWAAVMGARGTVEVRDHRRLIALDESSGSCWTLRAVPVLDGSLASIVGERATFAAAEVALEGAGIIPESRYEAEKALDALSIRGLEEDTATLIHKCDGLRRDAELRGVNYLTIRAIHERLGHSWPSRDLLWITSSGGRFSPPLCESAAKPSLP